MSIVYSSINSSYYFQLRKTVFDYAQREIAPKAAEIDKTNTFQDLKVILS